METAPRTLSIAHVDAEMDFSGGEVQVFLLVEGLAERGHRNVLVCSPGSRAAEEAVRRGIEHRTVPMRSDLDLPAVLRLRRALADAGVDLVHLHTGRATWLGGLAARLARRPAITTRRMDRPVRRGWRTRLVHERLTHRTVAISPAVRERLLEGGVPAARLRTISSAVDPRALRVDEAREAIRDELGLASGELVLLTLASLVPRKGLDVLLDAFARLGERGATLLVAGEGPERAGLEEHARRAGIAGRVRFLGRREDAPRLLAACDVFVLPSRREGLGVAALEAMAAGVAVVATRVGGLGEAVEDGRSGRLVEPGDPEALARALEELLGDDALRARLAAAGPARVAEGYLASSMTRSYEALYLEVLAGGAG